MPSSILAGLADLIVAAISAGGYLGILLLMAIKSACIPLPSEVIMPFAGYLVSTGRFSLVAAATAGALGCNLGSTLAYEVGRRGGRRLVERWGAYVLLDRRDLELADRFFARWGNLAVFVARLLPVVRTFISLPAGIAQMPRLPFQLYTFLGWWPGRCPGLCRLCAGRALEQRPRRRHASLDGMVLVVWRRWRVVGAAPLAPARARSTRGSARTKGPAGVSNHAPAPSAAKTALSGAETIAMPAAGRSCGTPANRRRRSRIRCGHSATTGNRRAAPRRWCG